ncbi:MAG: hypothetical protein LBD68_01605 [Zoogloeaceae bacterium]|jgi:hypothetical protein|nr:hypothetical protein [Zoogloeaceae bacterium]
MKTSRPYLILLSLFSLAFPNTAWVATTRRAFPVFSDHQPLTFSFLPIARP